MRILFAPARLAAALALATLGGCVGGARSEARLARARSSPPDASAAAEPRDAAPTESFGTETGGPAAGPVVTSPVILEDRYVGVVSKDDFAEFQRAWLLFVRKDRRWPEARERWLGKGGAAPNVLAENLVRYFLHASTYGTRRDLNWVAVSAQKIGEPAVGYFGSLLLLDERPLEQPVTARNSEGKLVEYRVWRNDDVTRQQLSSILAAIGEPSVATLATDAYLRRSSAPARRYVMHALGRIGSDRAVDALASMLSSTQWQDRGAAANGLGLALAYRRNERARPPLERARSDPDEFVRRKVEEALAGKTKADF